ncbi:MAG: glutamyl-tRNA reductase [Actinomycetota bacterium]|jgi:glutamyl-tRNA reductase|nr:glutamyl-tRNA reductase [Actinomycetota bacterium]
MSVLVVGISHRSAPVSLLERVTVGVGDQGVLRELRTTGPVGEAVVLATCNRVEVYTDTEAFHAGVDAVSDLLARLSGVPLEELSKHLYVHWEAQAVLHLFTVAAGLDSMVIGESQILGQLRRAYATARGDDSAGRVLHELFQRALRAGKRAHAETGIDEAGRSLVTVGLEHAAAAVGELSGRDALIIGAGSMAALSGATLRRRGAGRIVVANRTLDHARRLATSLDGNAVTLDEVEDALIRADIVVSCTGATGHVLDADSVERAMKGRDGRPIALIDIALPRDVDESVRDLPGVTLIDLSALQGVLDSTETGADVDAARAIVTEEVGTFIAWQLASRVAPTVIALRSRADEVVATELGRLQSRLPDIDERSRVELEATVRRVVDKLLHTPTVRVKELVEPPEGLSYADALRELFGLDRAAPAAMAVAPLVLEEDSDG